jgi:hypothetical protein
MRNLPGNADFAVNLFPSRGILRTALRQKLQSDSLAEPQVFCAIYLAHAAVSHRGNNAITVREQHARHESRLQDGDWKRGEGLQFVNGRRGERAGRRAADQFSSAGRAIAVTVRNFEGAGWALHRTSAPQKFAGKLGLGLTKRTTDRDELQSAGSTFRSAALKTCRRQEQDQWAREKCSWTTRQFLPCLVKT